jgi:signal peptidase I
MVPTFEKGDLVLMQTFDLDVKVGDIIMFPMYNIKEPITHRIVAIDEKGNIVTKGDANPYVDGSAFQAERVIGKAVIMGNKPVILKGLGYAIRPENIGEVTVLAKLPKTFVMAQAFSQFRAIQPLIIFFGTIFYFLLLLESRMDAKRKFNNNKKSIYGAGKIEKIK